ncbi:MAG: prepilin-type N-terminal cleavage/methylation domain-containing protein [Candidatus Colwellbacteria bacterium]|nr:prepilin-type N-terminal cleavage/methylation domain-containing protein [Candidatus Colwellbacteria bacterium]
MQNSTKKGFTLLELLIVITIISILSVILIIALNPAETLRKARDVQRISDLASLKNVIAIYITENGGDNSFPALDGDQTNDDNADCEGGGGTERVWLSADGNATPDTSIYANTAVYTDGDNGDFAVDGTGWIPVDFEALTGGSPISGLPIDPSNSNEVTLGTAVSDTTLVYTYVCSDANTTFEINAVLESADFVNGGPNDKEGRDGGNNDNLYEVGTELDIVNSR